MEGTFYASMILKDELITRRVDQLIERYTVAGDSTMVVHLQLFKQAIFSKIVSDIMARRYTSTDTPDENTTEVGYWLEK